ncbi:hypothetical protein ACJMK2_002614, partial [Sinanodonta woodiana]
MAAGRQECSICMDIFKNPKLLPCHHSFCYKCLEDYVKVNLSNGRFNCPMCRKSVELSLGGVASFQENFYIDTYSKEEVKLVCKDCKALICVLCKTIKHESHASETVSDAAAEVKKNIQIKMNQCLNKVRRITDSEREAEALDRKINDAERNEIKALEEQRLQLIKLIDQEVAKMKEKIQNVYKELRQQNESLKRDMKAELTKCSTVNDNARQIIDQGTDIDLIKKGSDLEQLLSAAMTETSLKPMTRMEKDLFSPVTIKVSELIQFIGMMRDSTEITP